MRKEKPSPLVSGIVLATAFVSLSTAVVNLWTTALKPASSNPPALAATCPAPAAAPQVIQYLGFPPGAPGNEKEPSRPAGQ